MNTQTARHLGGLAQLTAFARAQAFNDADHTSPAQFIADQLLRRCADLADDFIFLVERGHDLNASILQRSISERVFLLRYLRDKDQFMEFQHYSMAQEYRSLQRFTSQPQLGPDSKSTAQNRMKEIRDEMQGEPDKPASYWKYPKSKETITDAAEGHHNAPLLHINTYEMPSSAVHARHNDHEPTGIPRPAITRNAASQMAALTITALQIADQQETIRDLYFLIARIFPEHTDVPSTQGQPPTS